ncbi:hypothetical protein TcWFU_004710 [Taenia crassiceps]|uniref:Uncharacterized protein n=1 Tax=Taenia crassiceps TaxID=6207 RepID=A0ABR4Q3I8_9CEST
MNWLFQSLINFLSSINAPFHVCLQRTSVGNLTTPTTMTTTNRSLQSKFSVAYGKLVRTMAPSMSERVSLPYGFVPPLHVRACHPMLAPPPHPCPRAYRAAVSPAEHVRTQVELIDPPDLLANEAAYPKAQVVNTVIGQFWRFCEKRAL